MADQQEQLLQQNAELERQLADKTSELQRKNRELEIEAALERVRSRAMAMHSSEELNALAGILFNELKQLDIDLIRCVILILDSDTRSGRWLMANPEDPSNPMSFFVKYHEHPHYMAV